MKSHIKENRGRVSKLMDVLHPAGDIPTFNGTKLEDLC